MNWLYLIINVATIFFPIVLSFDKKVYFKRQWGATILAGAIVSIPFLIWDYFFTKNGFWGFTGDYLMGWKLGGLPIEEIFFFITIPFACIFIYECVRAYFPKKEFMNLNFLVYAGLFALLTYIIWGNKGGWYSISVAIATLITLGYVGRNRKKYPHLPLAFLISLIPFLVVNGVLTGAVTEAPVVWYNENEFSSVRLFTIPLEDILYSWNLIALNCLLFDRFRERGAKND